MAQHVRARQDVQPQAQCCPELWADVRSLCQVRLLPLSFPVSLSTIFRYTDNADIVKHFVYDLFFFKSPRNHLLVGIVVALWPQIFPKVNTDLAGSPLVETLVWCIFNTGPETFSAEMKIGETQENFERETGFKANSVKAESLVVKMIQVANDNLVEDETLEEIAKSFLVIGRCKGYRWVHNNIISRLLKSLGEGPGTCGKEGFMAWVISTLGLLSRIYPAEGRNSIKSIFESIESMLVKNELTPETENAYVYALFQLGHHLQMQVCIVCCCHLNIFNFNMLSARNVPQNLAAKTSAQHENSHTDGRFCRDQRETLCWEDCSSCHLGKKPVEEERSGETEQEINSCYVNI